MAQSKDLMRLLMEIHDEDPDEFAQMLTAATVVCEYGTSGEPGKEEEGAWRELTLMLANHGVVTGKGGHLRLARLIVACASV